MRHRSSLQWRGRFCTTADGVVSLSMRSRIGGLAQIAIDVATSGVEQVATFASFGSATTTVKSTDVVAWMQLMFLRCAARGAHFRLWVKLSPAPIAATASTVDARRFADFVVEDFVGVTTQITIAIPATTSRRRSTTERFSAWKLLCPMHSYSRASQRFLNITRCLGLRLGHGQRHWCSQCSSLTIGEGSCVVHADGRCVTELILGAHALSERSHSARTLACEEHRRHDSP